MSHLASALAAVCQPRALLDDVWFGARAHTGRIAQPRRQVAAIIAGTLLIRLLLSMALGLGIDESYMVAAGRRLQLSYFDHPPLAWWLTWGVAHVFGSEDPVVVRLPFMLLFAGSSWLLFSLTARVGSERAGIWAVLAFNAAPVFGLSTGTWVLPDGPLTVALLGLMLCLVRATESDRTAAWRWWLGVGLCGGLALLSKYTAVLVLVGVAMAFVSHPAQRRWLIRPQPWAAMLLILLLLMPVIVWNAEHHWASIAFQGRRGLGHRWQPFAPLAALLGEALFLLPWIWVTMMVALASALGRRLVWPTWLLAAAGLPAIALFALVGIWSAKPILFHWAAPGYLMLLPLLGIQLERWSTSWPRLVRGVSMATAGLVISGLTLVGSEVRWNWMSTLDRDFQNGADPDLSAVDWKSLAVDLAARPPFSLATLNWHDAGKLSYAVGRHIPVICLGDDPRQFGILNPAASHDGEDILVLVAGPNANVRGRKLGSLFCAVEPQAPLTLLHNGKPAMQIAVFLGRGLIGSAPSHCASLTVS